MVRERMARFCITMQQESERSRPRIGRECRSIAKRGRQVWRLVPASQKWSLFAALLLMGLTSAASTSIPLLLGKLVDGVNPQTHGDPSRSGLFRVAGLYLA